MGREGGTPVTDQCAWERSERRLALPPREDTWRPARCHPGEGHRQNPSTLVARSQTSGLQSCEQCVPAAWKPPGLRRFVMSPKLTKTAEWPGRPGSNLGLSDSPEPLTGT